MGRPADLALFPLGITKVVVGVHCHPTPGHISLPVVPVQGPELPQPKQAVLPLGLLSGQTLGSKTWELVVPQSPDPRKDLFWSSPGLLPSSLGPMHPLTGV